MKKTIIAFCAAASFAVLPTVSHAAETSNGGYFGHVIYMKWFGPQIELTFMQNSEQPVVVKKQSFVDKEQVIKPSTVKKEEVVKQPAVKEAVNEAPTEKPTPAKEQAAPVVVEKEEAVKQPAVKEETVNESTPEQTTPAKEQAAPVVVEKEEAVKQPVVKEEAIQQPNPEQTESNTTAGENSAQQTTKPTQVNESDIDKLEAAVVRLTNNERAKAGLAPLEMDRALMAAAREKSQDMSSNHYFSHTSPTFGSPFDRLKALGISYQAAGENIAKGQKTAEEVVTAWMNSEGHRANILDEKFTHIGVGFVKDGSIWTQQFIKK